MQLHHLKRIESFEPELEQYEELKEEGNYVQAHNHIMGLNESMNEVQKYMDEIPELIRKPKRTTWTISRFEIWLSRLKDERLRSASR